MRILHRGRAALLLAPLVLAGCASVMTMQPGGFNLISLDEEWSMREQSKRPVNPTPEARAARRAGGPGRRREIRRRCLERASARARRCPTASSRRRASPGRP